MPDIKDIEKKLQSITTTIDRSSKFSPQQKEQLYKTIYEEIQNVMHPVLLQFISNDDLVKLTNLSTKDYIETYGQIILSVLKQKSNLDELTHAIGVFLKNIEEVLQSNLS